MKNFFSLLYNKFSAPLFFAAAAVFVLLAVPAASFASEAAFSKYYRNRSGSGNINGNLNCPSGWTQVDTWLINEGDSADGGGGQHKGLACVSSAYTAAFSKYYRTGNRNTVPPCPAGWTVVDTWAVDEGDNGDGYGDWHSGVACASTSYQSAISKYYRERSSPQKFAGNLGCPSGWTGVDSWTINEGDSADGGGGQHRGLACAYSGMGHTKTYTKYYRSKNPVSCPSGWNMTDSWAVHEGDKNDGYGGWHAGGVCSQTPVSQPPVDFSAGDIIVNVTKNGSPWDAPVLTANYTTADGTFTSDFDFPQTFTGVQTGTYTVNWVTAPANENVTLQSVTPSMSQTLLDGGTITFTLNFVTTTPANGTIVVRATKDGAEWDSPPFAVSVNTPAGPFSGTVNPVESLSVSPGLYTVTSVTPPVVSPSVAFSGISPSASQTLASGSTITFTVNFTTVPPASGTIIVRTLKDGALWDSPPFTANYTGPDGTTNGMFDTNASGQQTISAGAGTYRVNSVIQPAGVTFQNINGSSLPYSQTLSNGGTITFTVNFASSVVATPDLASFINPFSVPAVGSAFTFIGSIRNNGNAVSAPTGTRWTIDGISLGNQNISGLNSGESRTLTSGSWTVTGGSHTIQLCADAVSGETNVSNNCAQFSFSVSGGALANLVPFIPLFPDVAVNQSFAFPGTIINLPSAGGPAAASVAMFRVKKSGSDWIVLNTPSVGALAVGASQDIVSSSWTPVTAGTYQVELSADLTGVVPEISELNIVTRTFQVVNPLPVFACSDGRDNDGDGKIDMSDPGCGSPSDNDETDEPPVVPSSLSIDPASLRTCGQIRLQWNDVANETHYEIERDGSVIPSLGVGADVTETVDRSIAQNTSYTYRMRACNDFGCSDWSNSVTDSNRSPRAGFSWLPQKPVVNQSVLLSDTSDYFAGIAPRQWTFQDGNPASATVSQSTTTVKFVDDTPELKSVRLLAADTAGRTCSATREIKVVKDQEPPNWEEIPPE